MESFTLGESSDGVPSDGGVGIQLGGFVPSPSFVGVTSVITFSISSMLLNTGNCFAGEHCSYTDKIVENNVTLN